MEILALSAPWILLLLVMVTIGLLAFRRRKMAAGLLLLAVCGNWWFEVVPVNIVQWGQEVQEGELKVLTFNCNLSSKDSDILEKRARVIRFIREQDADVMFLTENFIVGQDSLWIEIQDVYPYKSKDNNSVGNRLYSKFPIVSDTILKDNKMAYGITCCKIDLRGKRVNVIGGHLSSNNYNEQKVYMTPDSVGNFEQAKSYLGNILNASKCREKEAKRINDNLNPNLNDGGKLRIPTIVMGDFNDVCGSPTLYSLESVGLKDAWWEGGFGYGATIHYPLPFRIDHILYNDCLELKDIKKLDAHGLSDHDALVGNFIVK